jgi:hypothetical protein
MTTSAISAIVFSQAYDYVTKSRRAAGACEARPVPSRSVLHGATTGELGADLAGERQHGRSSYERAPQGCASAAAAPPPTVSTIAGRGGTVPIVSPSE